MTLAGEDGTDEAGGARQGKLMVLEPGPRGDPAGGGEAVAVNKVEPGLGIGAAGMRSRPVLVFFLRIVG